MDTINGWTSLMEALMDGILMDVIDGWQWTALMDAINGRH
jgi:hypothetical protein